MLIKIQYFLNLLKKQQNRKKRLLWKAKKIKVKRKQKLYLLNHLTTSKHTFSIIYSYFLDNLYLLNVLTLFHNFTLIFLSNFFSHKLRKLKTLKWVKINFTLLAPFVRLYRYFSKPYLNNNKKLKLFFRQRKRRHNQAYSFLKFFSVNKLFFYKTPSNSLYLNSFPLLQRVFTSPRLVKYLMKFWYWRNKNLKFLKYWSFFVKKNTQTYQNIFNLLYGNRKKKLKGAKYYFFDGNKSPLHALFLARQVHSKFGRKKTLRNVAYKCFLKKRLKILTKVNVHFTKLSLIVRSLKFTYTWYNTFLFIKLGFVFLNGERVYQDKYVEYNNIFQIPFFTKLYLVKFFVFYKSKFIKKKIKKIRYLNYLRITKLWMSRKKNTIRLMTWLYPTTLNKNFATIFDFTTGTGIVLSRPNYYYYFDKTQIEGSSLLKLYSWKFRST